MTSHLAILHPAYIRLILAGRKTVESRLSIHRIAPYLQIQPLDWIFFRPPSKPCCLLAQAAAVEYHQLHSQHDLTLLQQKYNSRICAPDDYWLAKRSARYATFIFLSHIRPISTGPILPPSRGRAWFRIPPHLIPSHLITST